jgi:hypothetical protein
VVAKSREIYEQLIEAEMDDEEKEEEVDEASEEEKEEGEDDLEENFEDIAYEGDDEMPDMGGDPTDDLAGEMGPDEEGNDEFADKAPEELFQDLDAIVDELQAKFDAMNGDDMGGDDMGGSDEPATKDDVMNLEDKLDELMAEFEGLMGGDDMGDMGDGDGFGPEEGGDAIEMDDTGEMEPGMMEAISMKAAPKPVTAEQGNGKAGPVAFNSGAAGMASKPVHTGTSMGGVHDSAAYRNTVKELGVTPTQDAGKKAFKSAAPAPVKSQASGVNTKSPLPSGRKG